MSAVRFVATVILGVSLSGCVTPQPPSGASNSLAVVARSVPTVGEAGNIDLFALRDIYLAQNPDRFGMPLYQRQRRGLAARAASGGGSSGCGGVTHWHVCTGHSAFVLL